MTRPSAAHRTLAPRAAPRPPVVILIDNYDSFTYNLAHLLVTAGCQVEVLRNDEVPAAQVAASGVAGVVISPGPCAPPEAGISVDVVRGCAGRIPLLGICLGHQAIAAAFGANVIKAPRPVHGQVCEVTHDNRGVLAGLPQRFHATRYHSLMVDEITLPPELRITARSGPLPMALRGAAPASPISPPSPTSTLSPSSPTSTLSPTSPTSTLSPTSPTRTLSSASTPSPAVEGVQFHPESILTANGEAIIRNFAQSAARPHHPYSHLPRPGS